MNRNLGNECGIRAFKSCKDCAASRYSEFKKVANIHESAIAIYMHTRSMRLSSDRCDKSSQTPESSKNPESFIVHNISDRNITGYSMIRELSRYRTSCVTCKGIIKRVRILLEEVRAIRKNEVYGICDHCKRTGIKCQRCEYICAKFKQEKSEEVGMFFKQWLFKVHQLLEAISKGNMCPYRLYQETANATELDNLLKELNSPMLAGRQLEIGAFPSSEFQENLAQSKDMLQELITKLKTESATKRYSSDDSLFTPASAGCVCKYLADRKTRQRSVLKDLNQQEPESTLIKVPSEIKLVGGGGQTNVVKDVGVKEKRTKQVTGSTVSGSVKEKKVKARKGSLATEETVRGKSTKARKGSTTDISSVTDKENKPEKKQKKSPRSQESKLFKKLLNQRTREKEKAQRQPKQIKTKLPSFGELPKLRALKKREVTSEDFSESVLECDEGTKSPKEMITGRSIVPFQKHGIQASDSVEPLLFKVKAEFLPSVLEVEPEVVPLKSTIHVGKMPTIKKSEIIDRSGVIRYRLSDRQFIEKGWTQLPSTKVLRRMNVYKMIPARLDDWFTRHKHRGVMFYNSGEKLAEIDKDGQGKWFYRNGTVALEYYNAEETFVQKRCVVYSSETCIVNKLTKSQTVLACFDALGNGVVYDSRGNERLKYNQTEGQLIDDKIGPPGYWKWHTLNEPPVLQKTFIDTFAKDRSTFKKTRDDDDDDKPKRDQANEAMLAVEFDNFVKEKANKLRQEFKPFQIRMKTVKINDFFSVRVIDQANICLLFRDGALTLKLDLGMLLQSKEIVDTESIELTCVWTSYDRRPARSKSVARLQAILQAAKGKAKECSHCDTPDSSV